MSYLIDPVCKKRHIINHPILHLACSLREYIAVINLITSREVSNCSSTTQHLGRHDRISYLKVSQCRSNTWRITKDFKALCYTTVLHKNCIMYESSTASMAEKHHTNTKWLLKGLKMKQTYQTTTIPFVVLFGGVHKRNHTSTCTHSCKQYPCVHTLTFSAAHLTTIALSKD